VSPLPINLKIYSPNVLNLTLVDLPGMTKARAPLCVVGVYGIASCKGLCLIHAYVRLCVGASGRPAQGH
jgi:hypothetical protein